MTEIPDDIMKAANECVAQFRWNNDNRWHLFVARAIQAERERAKTIITDRLAVYQAKEDRADFAAEDSMNRWDSYRHTREAHEILLEEFDASPKPAAVSEGGEDE